MKTFQIYKHPILGVRAVKVGFCWPAFFFGFLWMAASQLWGRLGLWLGLYVVAIIIQTATDTTSGEGLQIISYFILTAVYLVIAVFPAFLGNSWRVKNLLSRGFELASTVQAETKDAALAHLGSL